MSIENVYLYLYIYVCACALCPTSRDRVGLCVASFTTLLHAHRRRALAARRWCGCVLFMFLPAHGCSLAAHTWPQVNVFLRSLCLLLVAGQVSMRCSFFCLHLSLFHSDLTSPARHPPAAASTFGKSPAAPMASAKASAPALCVNSIEFCVAASTFFQL